MALWRLFRTEVGTLEFVTTERLSQYISHGPSIGIPKHLSLYLVASIISVHIRNAMYSDPKLDDSTVF